MSLRRKLSQLTVLIPLVLITTMIWHREAHAAQLNLTWSDISNNEDGFKIERKTGTSGTFAQIAMVGPDITTYTDSVLASQTTYCYRVRAFNTFGDSAYSNENCILTAAAGLLDHFSVEAAGGGKIPTQTDGTNFNIQITAQDSNNNTVTGFNGATNTVVSYLHWHL